VKSVHIKPKWIEHAIIVLIVYSVVVHFIELEFGEDGWGIRFFNWSDLIITILFTIEYFVRWRLSRRWSYPLQPMAVIDLLAILPFYLGFLIDLRTLRLLRALRAFRLFKLYRYSNAMRKIKNAFLRVRYEFAVVGFAVLTLGWVCATLLYELERDAQPQAFGRFSDSVWYTVVTLTTVGYGDKVPITFGGRCVAFVMMVAGLGLFGTFVSLIGSAFLEELRREDIEEAVREQKNPYAIDIPQHDLSELFQSTSETPDEST
jgi:voltage-gated potassium channel